MSEAQWFGLEDFPTVADLTAYDQVRNGPAPDLSTWEPIDLADLDETPPVQPTLGKLGLVYPGKRHVFSGPQESAKTLAAYVIGLEVVRSGSELVLIDFEMGRWDARNRLRELGASMDELRKIRYLEPDVPASTQTIGALVEREPGLVVIDAVAGAFELHSLDDNRRADVERFSRLWLQPFRRAGIATIVLDHVVKAHEGRGAYAIGSERKVGGADVHLGFEVVHPIKRGAKGLYKIITHKDRGGFLKRGKLAEFELESDPDTHRIDWKLKATADGDEEHEFRPTVLMEKVSRWLEGQLTTVSQHQVEEANLGKRDYVRQALDILVTEVFVDETSGPRNARLFESIRAYREDDDDLAPTSPNSRGEVLQSTSHDFAPSPMGGEVVGDLAPEGQGELGRGPADDLSLTCRKCRKTFRRGSGNRGDLCGECAAEEIPF